MISPPIVGVPALAECWVTDAWMGWPTPAAFNHRMSNGVPMRATTNATAPPIRIPTIAASYEKRSRRSGATARGSAAFDHPAGDQMPGDPPLAVELGRVVAVAPSQVLGVVDRGLVALPDELGRTGDADPVLGLGRVVDQGGGLRIAPQVVNPVPVGPTVEEEGVPPDGVVDHDQVRCAIPIEGRQHGALRPVQEGSNTVQAGGRAHDGERTRTQLLRPACRIGGMLFVDRGRMVDGTSREPRR